MNLVRTSSMRALKAAPTFGLKFATWCVRKAAVSKARAIVVGTTKSIKLSERTPVVTRRFGAASKEALGDGDAENSVASKEAPHDPDVEDGDRVVFRLGERYLSENYSEEEQKRIVEVINSSSKTELESIPKFGKRRAAKIEKFKTERRTRLRLSEEDSINRLSDLLLTESLSLVEIESICQSILANSDRTDSSAPAFCVPRPSKGDVERLASFAVLDVDLSGIVAARVTAESEKEIRDATYSPEEGKSTKRSSSTIAIQSRLSLDLVTFLDFDFSSSDQKSTYKHARYLEGVSAALADLPPADAYFLVDRPTRSTERNPAVIKRGVNSAFVEGLVVAHLALREETHLDCGVNVFKVKPDRVAAHFGLRVGRNVKSAANLVEELLRRGTASRKGEVNEECGVKEASTEISRSGCSLISCPNWTKQFLRKGEDDKGAFASVYLTALFVADMIRTWKLP